MGRSEVTMLQEILERRKKAEDEVAQQLTAAADVLRRAEADERHAMDEVIRLEEGISSFDAEAQRALEKGVRVDALSANAAYRRGLVSDFEGTQRGADQSRRARGEAEEAHRQARRFLAETAARRVAAEKLLEKAHREEERRVEERMEEEAADLMAARGVEEESSC